MNVRAVRARMTQPVWMGSIRIRVRVQRALRVSIVKLVRNVNNLVVILIVTLAIDFLFLKLLQSSDLFLAGFDMC